MSSLLREAHVRRGAVTGLLVVACVLAVLPLLLLTGIAQASCPNEAVRVGAGANLPDCRGYELISPADKNGGLVPGATFLAGPISDDGQQVFFGSANAFGDASQGAVNLQRADRGTSGWASMGLVPPATISSAQTSFADVTEDGRFVLVRSQDQLDPGDQDAGPGPTAGFDLYLRGPDGTYSWVSKGDMNTTDPNDDIEYGGQRGAMSADGSHVVFSSSDPLLASDLARTGQYGLYDWHDGQVRLVALDNAGNLLGAGQVDLGDGPHAVSDDGSRIFFSVEGDTFLYAREDGTTTVRIPRLATAPSTAINFKAASADGSKVFFDTTAPLMAEDTNSSDDLYEYDLDTGGLTRISGGNSGTADPLAIGSAVRVSDDGSYVYFSAEGALTSDTSDTTHFKLYVYHAGTTTLIGQGQPFVTNSTTCSQWTVTPDGRHTAFISTDQMVPGDTDSSTDMYLYDAVQGRLVDASLGSVGGNGAFPVSTVDSFICGYARPRLLSDDGRYVFFTTSEGLVSQDVNGQEDVYEYDALTGTTSLISAGTGSQASRYVDNSPSGADVVFSTYDPLVPQDVDGAEDLYDARIDGGFSAAPVPSECSGDACQGTTTAFPGFAAPGSVTFEGPGNVTSAPRRGSLAVAPITKRALARFARTGRLTLTVKVPQAGLVSAVATSRLRRHGRVVARALRRAQHAGTIHLNLKLSRSARLELVRHRRLHITLKVTMGGVRSRSAHLTLDSGFARAKQR